jgi:hypothetical protein
MNGVDLASRIVMMVDMYPKILSIYYLSLENTMTIKNVPKAMKKLNVRQPIIRHLLDAGTGTSGILI